MTTLAEVFDRLAIIHLPSRTDRYAALERELRRIGIDIHGAKVQFPDPPMPEHSNGLKSRGVYGNFLSHLDILKTALRDKLSSVWVLEDDAIFRARFREDQKWIGRELRQRPWDMCYLGHTLRGELRDKPRGLMAYAGPFYWAHCYAVRAHVLPRLVEFLEETLSNPPGHPRGGKIYVDAAYTFFRKLNPDVITLVTNPVLSVQRGSPSGLVEKKWYDSSCVTKPLVAAARALRDEGWRRTGWWLAGSRPTSYATR
jgi:glycosyl transferase, family 25